MRDDLVEEESTSAITISEYTISSSAKRVYSKLQLVALFPHDNSSEVASHIISMTLRDFYPSYVVFERGSKDGIHGPCTITIEGNSLLILLFCWRKR